MPFIAAVAGRHPEPTPLPALPSDVDHLVYAVPDLGSGIDEMRHLLGVQPALGGRHPEFGTRNALVALGRTTYLEIIAPDPQLPTPERGRLFDLGAGERGRLVTWALRSEAIDARAALARAHGLALGPVQQGSRRAPDGTSLRWRLTDPYAMPMSGSVPFLIAWGETPHPAAGAPRAGELVGLRVEHPDPAAVRRALSLLGVSMTVTAGPRMRLIARVRLGSRDVEIR